VIEPHDITIRMVGIGGTGVVTAAQVIGTAAMMAGYRCGLDQVGLSQKAGPVVRHLTLNHDAESTGAGQADVLLVFDALVAASHLGTKPSDLERTVVSVELVDRRRRSRTRHADAVVRPEAVLDQVTQDRSHRADLSTSPTPRSATPRRRTSSSSAWRCRRGAADRPRVRGARAQRRAGRHEPAALRLAGAIADPGAVAHATLGARRAPIPVEFLAADLDYQDGRYADVLRASCDRRRRRALRHPVLRRTHRRGRAQPVQAHGVQRRVRWRASLDDDAMAEGAPSQRCSRIAQAAPAVAARPRRRPQARSL
jgi:hypothetical protein